MPNTSLPDIGKIAGEELRTAINDRFNAAVLTDEDIEITDATKGVIQKSPNGTRYRVTIGNDGSRVVTAL